MLFDITTNSHTEKPMLPSQYASPHRIKGFRCYVSLSDLNHGMRLAELVMTSLVAAASCDTQRCQASVICRVVSFAFRFRRQTAKSPWKEVLTPLLQNFPGHKRN